MQLPSDSRAASPQVMDRLLLLLTAADEGATPLRAAVPPAPAVIAALRAAAAESTARHIAGKPLSPLDGVPVLVKDELQASGAPRWDPSGTGGTYTRCSIPAGKETTRGSSGLRAYPHRYALRFRPGCSIPFESPVFTLPVACSAERPPPIPADRLSPTVLCSRPPATQVAGTLGGCGSAPVRAARLAAGSADADAVCIAALRSAGALIVAGACMSEIG